MVVAEKAIKDGVVMMEDVVAEEKDKGNDVLVLETPEATIITEIFDEPPQMEEEEIAIIKREENEIVVEERVCCQKRPRRKLKATKAEKEAEARLKKAAEVEKEDEKKKKKRKEKNVGKAESSHHQKFRKNKEKKYDNEDEGAKKKRRKEKEDRRLQRKKKRHLREEEKAKQRAASPEKDGELTSVVWGFYRGHLHGNRDAVTFKGETVHFSAKDINELYQMRDNPDAPGSKIIDDPIEELMRDALKVLAQPGIRWAVSPKGIRTLESKSLLPEGRLWVYLVKK
ncbi:nucleolar protein 58-like [Benincasa hispida]|uniref:nucleolar protein 58-like n=1 Tax=Benincasa hispida TaxID=102211 RepID=UPI001900C0B1|nr:nucleolar protein 58-like [Benincasa hispida]